MISDTRNVKLGVCKIFFDGADLGYTQGGVEFNVTTSTRKVNVDQFGTTPIKESITGREATATVPLAEATVENMAKLMPSLNLTIEGNALKRVGVDSGTGLDLLETAKMLVLHPVGLKDFDYSDEVVIPLANTPGQMNFAYQLEAERIFNTTFSGYPDPQTGALFFSGNIFTDAVGKTFTFSQSAVGSAFTSTGLTAALTGKLVMLGAVDDTSVMPTGVSARKSYYAKYVSATGFTLHATREAALAGTGAIATTAIGSGSGLKMTILA